MKKSENYSNWKGWCEEDFGKLTDPQRRKIESQLKKMNVSYTNVNAIEVGFGNGSLLYFLKEQKCEVVGIETNDILLSRARRSGIDAYDSLERLVAVLPEKKYDLIVGFDVLEHMSVEELMMFFSNCQRLLSDTGQMVFRFPNADSFAGLNLQNGDHTHITALGFGKLEGLICPYGLEINAFEGELTYPKRIVIDGVRSILRRIFTLSLGVGNSYYFSENVVVKISRKLRNLSTV